MFVGYLLQTEGLARTTATNAGFITGLYVVFAPLIASVAFRQRAPGAAWLAVGMSVAGLSLLSIADLGAISVHAGDLLVLAGAIAWSGHIVAVSRFAPRFPPWMLSLAQMGVASLLQVVAIGGVGFRFETASHLNVWPLLVINGVLGSGVAFTIQIMAQKELTPVRAVVLLAGESIFSAFFAAIWLGERLRAHQWAGAILAVGAMAYSELSARRSETELVDPAVP
jgi:drug/metabolite transporter (DMT)-like permease